MGKTSCAIDFFSQNYDAINALQIKLLEQLKKFTDTFGQKFAPKDVEAIHAAIQKNLVGSAIGLIRQQHINMHDRGARYAFWSIVDACNFFLDATTSRWTYVSVEGRKQYLKFAEESLNEMWDATPRYQQQAA